MMRQRSDLPPVDPQPWAALIPPDSFYARLAEVRDILVDDDLYRPLYKDSTKGRPSLPPSLVVLTMMLQYHDDSSDRDTEARVRFDLRWKHALGLALEDTGFDATVLSVFRRKLLEQGLDRALFDRLVKAAQDAGLLANNQSTCLSRAVSMEILTRVWRCLAGITVCSPCAHHTHEYCGPKSSCEARERDAKGKSVHEVTNKRREHGQNLDRDAKVPPCVPAPISSLCAVPSHWLLPSSRPWWPLDPAAP